MAGMVGLEPTNHWVKVSCVTFSPHPIIKMTDRIWTCNPTYRWYSVPSNWLITISILLSALRFIYSGNSSFPTQHITIVGKCLLLAYSHHVRWNWTTKRNRESFDHPFITPELNKIPDRTSTRLFLDGGASRIWTYTSFLITACLANKCLTRLGLLLPATLVFTRVYHNLTPTNLVRALEVPGMCLGHNP